MMTTEAPIKRGPFSGLRRMRVSPGIEGACELLHAMLQTDGKTVVSKEGIISERSDEPKIVEDTSGQNSADTAVLNYIEVMQSME